MNLSFPAIAKWLVAFASCIGAGLFAYGQAHKGPPVTPADWWDVFMTVLAGTGIGAIGRGSNVAIQKAAEAKAKRNGTGNGLPE